MAINKRNLPGNKVQDLGAIANLQYSNSAGSQKVSEVGRNLLPLATPGIGTGFTTNFTTAMPLPGMGKNLAVYNNASSVGTITLAQGAAPTALTPGATNSSGQAGIPCAPNAWTYIACGYNNWAIASASTLLVFLIDDQTSIAQESLNVAST